MRFQNQDSCGARAGVFMLNWVNMRTPQNVSKLRYILLHSSETLSYSN